MTEHDTLKSPGFVRASELYHVEQSNRITHPAKSATDRDISKIFDFDRRSRPGVHADHVEPPEAPNR